MEKQEFFTIYKITNLITEKIYIGVHKTKNLNDSYMGSGKVISQSIVKYGRSSFKKEILELCKDEDIMYELEAKYVNVEFVNRKDTYNIRIGGVRANFEKIARSNKGQKRTDEQRLRMSNAQKGKTLTEAHKAAIGKSGKGRVISEETRRKISNTQKGKKIIGTHLENLRKSFKNRIYTDEQRKNLSDRGKNISDETRRKMSKSGKNRPKFSAETCKKMSESQLKRLPMSKKSRKKLSKSKTGVIWICNSNNDMKQIKPDILYKWTSKGWMRGMKWVK